MCFLKNILKSYVLSIVALKKYTESSKYKTEFLLEIEKFKLRKNVYCANI